jgi:chromosomal replication initiator protein
MAKHMLLNESVNDAWSAVQSKLKAEYGEATYKSWLSKLSLYSVEGGQVVLTVPTKFIREWIFSNYAAKLKSFWMQMDSSVLSLDILVRANTAAAATAPQPAAATVAEAPASVIVKEENIYLIDNYKEKSTSNDAIANNNDDNIAASLDPRFTFDNFVVGGSNELAHAAARAVAESPKVQPECNPLFLYGGVGLGKTHLMHSIAWHIKKTNPSRKVIYLSAEKFMYQFVRALRNKDIMSFKEQFRSVDVLMIDDVQFICGKDSTQEEFFHTFNALIDNNRQLVISCDRSPSDLEGMEERIRSRLGWGLVADVHTTTYELRLGILQSKVEQMNVEVPQRVIEFLASKITSNVRELEGALNKVIAHSSLIGREITLDSTQEILQDLLRSNERIVTIEEIQKKVAEYYNIRVSDMSSSRRLRTVARPRQIAMYLCKQLTPRSLAEIGRKFGGKDHTTVMHAVKKVEELAKGDQEFNDDLRLIARMLQS